MTIDEFSFIFSFFITSIATLNETIVNSILFTILEQLV